MLVFDKLQFLYIVKINLTEIKKKKSFQDKSFHLLEIIKML